MSSAMRRHRRDVLNGNHTINTGASSKIDSRNVEHGDIAATSSEQQVRVREKEPNLQSRTLCTGVFERLKEYRNAQTISAREVYLGVRLSWVE